MRHRTGTWMIAAALVAACGGGGDDDAAGQIDAGEPDVLATVADVLGDVAAETEDAPGLVRFVNLLQADGTGVDVDVWWGRPEDGQRAATLGYGEASDYLTPRQSSAFDEVSWSMSAVGGQEQLIGFSYTPAEDIQRTLVAFPDHSGSGSNMWTQIDEILPFDPDIGAWGFQPPDPGQVRVKWVPIPPVIEAPSGNLRNVGTGTAACLTNGSGINAEDDLSTRSTTFQVPAGTALQLYEDFPTCTGAATASATAPGGGRAVLLAYVDPAGEPQLMMLPVEG